MTLRPRPLSKYARCRAALYARLVSEPFNGTAQDLAEELGFPRPLVRLVISDTRKPSHIHNHSWTVPRLKRRGGNDPYRVVDSDELANDEAMTRSNTRCAEDMLNFAQRHMAAADLALASLDQRSQSARFWRDVRQSYSEVAYRLEVLIENER